MHIEACGRYEVGEYEHESLELVGGPLLEQHSDHEHCDEEGGGLE